MGSCRSSPGIWNSSSWEKGNYAFAQILVGYDADVNARDNAGRTPLIEASHGGPWKKETAVNIVDLLVKNDANVDIFTASAIGNANIIGHLLKQSKDTINDVDQNGQTAHYTMRHATITSML